MTFLALLNLAKSGLSWIVKHISLFIILVLIAVCVFLNWKWKSTETAWAKEKAATLQANKEATAKLTAGYEAKLKEYQDETESITNSRDELLAGINSGKYILRNKFKCAAPSLPKSTSPAAPVVNQAQGGLSEEDAEFLVRESARADQEVTTLNMCINLLGEIYDDHQ